MRHSFHDLDTVTDEVHALFDAWTEGDRFQGALQEEGVDVLRLAVHEWIANLVQHATFPNGVRITLDIEPNGDGVACSIEDTSAGFDFAGQVEQQQAILDAPAPSERGRGLLMLVMCTQNLGFVEADNGLPQRITFTVRDLGGEIFAPLFETASYDALPPHGDAGSLPPPQPSA